MTTATALTLTPLERDILLHRLACCDSIADVYCDTLHDDGTDQERQSARDHMYDAACRAYRGLLAGVEVSGDAAIGWALAEAVNGSTWIGCMIANDSDAKIARHITAGQSLAAKITAATGEPCEFPTY